MGTLKRETALGRLGRQMEDVGRRSGASVSSWELGRWWGDH